MCRVVGYQQCVPFLTNNNKVSYILSYILLFLLHLVEKMFYFRPFSGIVLVGVLCVFCVCCVCSVCVGGCAVWWVFSVCVPVCVLVYVGLDFGGV